MTRRFIETAIKNPAPPLGGNAGESLRVRIRTNIHITPDHCHLFPVTYRPIGGAKFARAGLRRNPRI